MWFDKKGKKEWIIRTEHPCDNSDCVSWMEWQVKYDNYSRYSGTIEPRVFHCLFCNQFKRTDCYVKEDV